MASSASKATACPVRASLLSARPLPQCALAHVCLRVPVTTLEEVFLRLAEIVEQEELQAAEERRRAVSAAKAAGDAFEAADIGTSRTSKRSTDLSRLGAARSGRFSLDAQGNPVPAVAKPANSRKADCTTCVWWWN